MGCYETGLTQYLEADFLWNSMKLVLISFLEADPLWNSMKWY